MPEMIEGQMSVYDFIGPGGCDKSFDPFNGFQTTGWQVPMLDDWFQKVQELLPGGDFWYLAGPMSGRPGFNYAEFDRIAAILRGQKYPIVSPAEFEHEQMRAKLMAAEGTEPHDEVGPSWAECLARDVTVVAHPSCIGIIAIEGWRESKGAMLETHVVGTLGKPIMEFGENPLSLIEVDFGG